ncbi:fumarylacetoacetate hydrolase family protein [Desulfoluna spongiiphila]|uniref:fumarylacetoacetate hydrolase family protein n=1 Tax=Desulfoluna spongiiphila TaxID=419481 RepID=UPI0012585DE5|nr:fumarylacetoacetate hydrolase family protein [Desulfoluna spongiiphila]VVS95252.1 fumarylacetoacetase-like c-terminal [Desulfoluna spongiiphila]
MKLVTWLKNGDEAALGALTGDDDIVDLKAAATLFGVSDEPFESMLSLIRSGEGALDAARHVMVRVSEEGAAELCTPMASARLLAPLPVPESVRDAMAFEDHIINCIRVLGLKQLGLLDEKIERRWGRRFTLARLINRAWYDRPVYYKSNRFSVVGHGAEVPIPSYCRRFDYELELGIVIGKAGADIPAARAEEHIFGYTLFNDFSARDEQIREMKGRLGPAKGKDFNGGNAMGPVLVTRDEILDPRSITLTARVNGQEWSRGSTADMHWSFEEIIQAVSRDETLYPGEFIGSGTCSGKEGRGCGLEMGRFLSSGDTVELSADGIGTLRNRVI